MMSLCCTGLSKPCHRGYAIASLNPSAIHLEIGGTESEKSLNVVLFGADAGNVTANTFKPFLRKAGSRLYAHTPSLTDFGATDTPLQTRSSFASLRLVSTFATTSDALSPERSSPMNISKVQVSPALTARGSPGSIFERLQKCALSFLHQRS